MPTAPTLSNLGTLACLPQELRDDIWQLAQQDMSRETNHGYNLGRLSAYRFRVFNPDSQRGPWCEDCCIPIGNWLESFPGASRRTLHEVAKVTDLFPPPSKELRIQVDDKGWKLNCTPLAFSRSNTQPDFTRFQSIAIDILPPRPDREQLLQTRSHLIKLVEMLRNAPRLPAVEINLSNPSPDPSDGGRTWYSARATSAPGAHEPEAQSDVFFPSNCYGDTLQRSVAIRDAATSSILGFDYYLSDMEIILRPLLRLRNCARDQASALHVGARPWRSAPGVLDICWREWPWFVTRRAPVVFLLDAVSERMASSSTPMGDDVEKDCALGIETGEVKAAEVEHIEDWMGIDKEEEDALFGELYGYSGSRYFANDDVPDGLGGDK
ncbi:hypothetical protein H2203_007236 [Taxawa tesnikishii (nom. ined.)]|nr:hypothetical protein H2203_007236 [Dothideales sp. JES 119]